MAEERIIILEQKIKRLWLAIAVLFLFILVSWIIINYYEFRLESISSHPLEFEFDLVMFALVFVTVIILGLLSLE